MAIKLILRGRDGDLTTVLRAKTQDFGRKLEQRIGRAVRLMAKDIKRDGDGDIQAGGNFGTRWTSGFHVDVEGDGFSSKVNLTHDVPYWRIFQFGGVIHGNPMLWIPLPGTDAVGVRAADYPGGLFHVVRKSDGLELLGSVDAAKAGATRTVRVKGRGAKRAKSVTLNNVMRYFGKASVTEKKRFHLIEIGTQALANFGQYFKRALPRG